MGVHGSRAEFEVSAAQLGHAALRLEVAEELPS